MQTIQIHTTQGSYPVYLGHDLIGETSIWREHLGPGQVLVVSNEVVAPIYLPRLRSALPGSEVAEYVIPDGEHLKSSETWNSILDHLVRMQARRDTTLIALGGGVVGDITGFVAATYMRGVRFIQVPTTLLAQVDASVGGKTGINHPHGKNLIGAFHQPAAVFIDTATLSTLQAREFNAGLAEVVKYGAIMDRPLFDWLEESAAQIRARQADVLLHLIHQSVQNKAKIVAADERETGVRAILNFGHSFGHALETLTGYRRYLHGEAVAIGMVAAARLSELRNLCDTGVATRLKALLQCFDLPVEMPASLPAAAIIAALELDKKAVAGGLRLILLKELGMALIDAKSKRSDIEAAIEFCQPSQGNAHMTMDSLNETN